jgi:hypothetical protein
MGNLLQPWGFFWPFVSACSSGFARILVRRFCVVTGFVSGLEVGISFIFTFS